MDSRPAIGAPLRLKTAMQDNRPTNPPPPVPWGYWATLGWAVLAFVVSLVVTAGVLQWLHLSPAAIPTRRSYDGATITVTIFVSTPVQIAVLAWAASWARWPAADYLGLVLPRPRETLIGLAVTLIIAAGFDALFLLFGQDLVSPFQVGMYQAGRAGGWLAWLFLAVALVAPIGEEIVFRGFLFRGWARTRTDAPYAIVVIALVWSLLHIQYNWLGILQVFSLGLWLGFVRWTSGSTLLTIMMHALVNLGAMIETLIFVEWWRPAA